MSKQFFDGLCDESYGDGLPIFLKKDCSSQITHLDIDAAEISNQAMTMKKISMFTVLVA